MIDKHGGRRELGLDTRAWKRARGQIRGQTQSFQAIQAAYLFTVGHRKSGTLPGLAHRIGVPAATLAATVKAYNDGITGGAGDPAHKAADMCAPIEQGPFYAIDISIRNSSAYPASG